MSFFGRLFGGWLGSLFGRAEQQPAQQPRRPLTGTLVSLHASGRLTSGHESASLGSVTLCGYLGSSGSTGEIWSAEPTVTLDDDDLSGAIFSVNHRGQLRTLTPRASILSGSHHGWLTSSRTSAQLSSIHTTGTIQ